MLRLHTMNSDDIYIGPRASLPKGLQRLRHDWATELKFSKPTTKNQWEDGHEAVKTQARVFCLRNQKEGTLSETIRKPKLDFPTDEFSLFKGDSVGGVLMKSNDTETYMPWAQWDLPVLLSLILA